VTERDEVTGAGAAAIPWTGYASSLVGFRWQGRVLRAIPDTGSEPWERDWDLSVITAFNPGSVRRSRERNHCATRELRSHLVSTGVPFVAAVGYSPDLSWVEPGFALIACPPATARRACTLFGQVAYFRLAGGQVSVIDAQGACRSSVPAAIGPPQPGSQVPLPGQDE
jgi:Protein of unknown function (DUF3293)